MYTEKFEKFIDSIYKESEYYSKVFFYRWYNAIGAYYSSIGMEDDDIIAFLREYPVDIVRAYKYCPDVKPEVFAARHYASAYVPTTIEKGFKILDKVFPLQGKEFAIDESKDEFCTEQHMDLGMWIRNNWIYRPEVDDSIVQERYDKCYTMLIGNQPGEPMLDHPDEVSGRFLETYYDHLKEFVAVKNNPIPVRRKPVKCRHCGHKVLRIQYGYPSHEMMEASERGEILLGGCIVSEDSPDYACPICGQSYCRVQFYDD